MKKSTNLALVLILCLTAFMVIPSQYLTRTVKGATMNLTSETDALIFQSKPGVNYGSWTLLETTPKTGSVIRTWIRFDLSSIPAGATVESAKLKLYYYGRGSPSPSGRDLECHHCTDDSWTESGITWSNAPNSQCAASATDTTSVPSSYGWMEWDVTADVQSDYAGDLSSSWRIEDTEEGTSSHFIVKIASKEYTTASLRPILEVEYVTDGFSISLSPSTSSLPNKVGEETTVTVTVSPIGGWAGDVDLSVTGLPAGVSHSFTDDPVTLSGATEQTILTIHVDTETTPGTYTVTVSGSGTGGKTGQSTLSLTITPVQTGNYPFSVKTGASKIIVTCTWSGTGTMEITLIKPDSTEHLESGLIMYERNTINVESGTTVYHHLKRVEFTTTPTAGIWTLKLTISGVTTYQADIEVI